MCFMVSAVFCVVFVADSVEAVLLHILVRFISAACACCCFVCLAGTSTESVCPIVTQNVKSLTNVHIRTLDILCPIVICRDLFLSSWPAF